MQQILDLFPKDHGQEDLLSQFTGKTEDYLQGLAKEAYRIFRRDYNRLEDNRNSFRSAVNKVMPKIPDHLPDRISLYIEIRKEIFVRLGKIVQNHREEVLAKPLPTARLPHIKTLQKGIKC